MPEQILIWTCVAVFVVTALITLLGIIEEPKIVVIKDKWLKPLYVALILEVVSVGVLVFEGHIKVPGAEAKSVSVPESVSVVETETESEIESEISLPDNIKALKDEKNVNDFFRMFFLPTNSKFSNKLGRPDAERVFVAPSNVFEKTMPLGAVAKYLGNDFRAIEDVYLLKCNPHDTRVLDARLATWSNIFELIEQDFQVSEADCQSDKPKTIEEMASCVARKYTATSPGDLALDSLVNMYKGASELYSKKLGRFLKNEYGITEKSFIGTGHIVSGTGGDKRFRANDLLVGANIPEYLVKNVPISEGSCKCIVVTPYSERQGQLFNISVFSEINDIGKCHETNKLPKI